MINSVLSSNIAKKGLIGVLLLGSSGISSAAISKNALSNNNLMQNTVLISKEGANALKSNFIGYNSIKRIPDKQENEYDSQGRIVKECYYDKNNKLYCYYTYEYLSGDDLNKAVKYNSDGKIDWQRDYIYNTDGTKKEITIFSDGLKWVQKFDAEDYIKESVIYNPDGSIDLRYVYQNDNEGKRIETIYDGNNNVVE